MTLILLMASSGLAVGMLVPNAAAVTKYTNSNGYQGNGAIYMAPGIPSTSPYLIAGTYARATGTSSVIKDAINVTVGDSARTPLTTRVFHEYYDAADSSLVVELPLVAAGAGQISYPITGSPVVQPASQKLNLAISGAASSVSTSIKVAFNSGINVTGPDQLGTTKSEALINVALDAASFLPTAGYAIGTYQMMRDLEALTGAKTFNLYQWGNGAVYEVFNLKGGIMGPGIKGQNVFASQILLQLEIPASAFMTGTMTLTAAGTNQLTMATCSGMNCQVQSVSGGASASLTIYAYPAVLLTGKVYALGVPLANQVIDFTAVSTQVVYETKTDANGNYQWFAAPNTAYTLTSTYITTVGVATGSTSFTTPNSATTKTVNLALPVALVYGYVKDQYGYPIVGASVQVTPPLEPMFSISTSSTGYYAFTVKTLGTYSLFASAYGYSPRSGSVGVGAFNRTYQAATLILGPYIPPPPPPPPSTCRRKPCPV